MKHASLRGALVCALLAHAPAAFAQSRPVVELKNLKPREVQSAVFTLAAPQQLRLEAVGSEAAQERGTFSWVTAMWNGKDDREREPWMGNAWILDLKSRRVVWELSGARTERGRRSTREFNGSITLPAGTYEAFYSAFPTFYVTDDNDSYTQKFMDWLADQGFDLFRFAIHGNAQVLAGVEGDRARRALDSGAILRLKGERGPSLLQSGFSLDRATDVEVYVEGEAREDAEFDTGWIINADTHEKIWKLTWRDSAPAGGALKNRMARVTKTLPAGRYAAFYATDDSHDPHLWNAPPPYDPDAWGLTIRAADSARASVKSFTYEHVPAASTIAALTHIGDSDARSKGFTLKRPMDVRVYAIGEGRDGRMFDYGWIVNAATRQRVWQMSYGDTEHAGGDAKNRLFDRTIHLDKGDYILHYISDGSHSYSEWNASAPPDADHWGITVLASGTMDRAAIAEYSEKADPSVLAQIVRARDDENARKRFVLDRETQVRIYALGEASGRTMVDYGWIEDAKTGKTVWEMTYRPTEAAGGAAKNRKFEGTITLPAGEYTVRYETDDSHAFGTWNANPPDDPDMWGITIYRVK